MDPRLGVVQVGRDPHRRAAQLGHPVALGGVVDRPAQPVEQLDAVQRALAVGELERPLQQPDHLVVDHPGLLDVATRRADRGAREARRVAEPLRQLTRRPERLPRLLALAGLDPRLAECVEQLAPAPFVLRREPGGDLHRPRVVLGGLLVGLELAGALGGRARVADRLLGVLAAGGAGEMVRERSGGGLSRRLERLADAAMDARPTGSGHPLVQSVADQGVREAVAPRLAGRLEQQPGGERLLQRPQKLLLVELEQLLEQRGVEVAPDHRRDPQPLDRLRLEPACPARDHLFDALGQPDPL